MTTTNHPLPDHWRITFRKALDLTAVTLIDESGVDRQTTYHSKPVVSTPVPGAASSLDEIKDVELRETAQELIDAYFRRLAKARANAEAFYAAFPDLDALRAQLRSTAPSCEVFDDIDGDHLTVRLTLQATGPDAGQLFAVVASWPGYGQADTPLSGFDCDLDGSTITATFNQAHATDFLTWLRTRS
jgi:hypothetical protein